MLSVKKVKCVGKWNILNKVGIDEEGTFTLQKKKLEGKKGENQY